MMKIQSRLLIFIGASAAFAAAAAICIAFIAMNHFLTKFRMQESAYSSNVMTDTAKTAVIYEAKLVDEQANLLFTQLENLLKTIRVKEKKETRLVRDFLQETPLADQYVRLKLDKKNPDRTVLLNSSPETMPAVSRKTHPDLIDFILMEGGREEPSKSLVYSPANELVPASLWLVIAYQTSEDKKKGFFSAVMVKLNDQFFPLALAKDPGDRRRYMLFEGENVICKSPEIDTTRYNDAMLVDFCRKASAHAGNSYGAEILSLPDGTKLCITAARILTPEYLSAKVHLVCAFRFDDSLPNFFAYVDSRFRMAFFLAVGAALAGLLLLIPVMAATARSIATPIAQATVFADALARNEFPKEPLKMSGAEELVILGKSLNFMRDRLSSTISKLKRSHERESAARKEAENANALKSELLSKLSIELRNPLNTIKGFSSLIVKDAEKRSDAYPPELRPLAATIHESADNLNDMVNSLIELAKLNQTPRKLQRQETDVAAILKQTAEQNAPVASFRSITLERRYLPGAVQMILTDPMLLLHTLLLSESALIRLLPPGGKVVISYGGNERKLFFSIQDSSGKTPSARSLAEAYRLYCAGDKKNTSSGEISSILNLMILEDNARLLGAEFSVEEQEHGSTCLRFVFPKEELSAAGRGSGRRNPLADIRLDSPRHSAAHRQKQRNENPRILVADVNELNRRLISMILSDIGADIDFAASADECREQLNARRFDILILDLDSIAIDTEDVLARLKEDKHHETAVIILSSALDEEARRRYLALGARCCLVKPINIDMLHNAVREY